MLLFFFFIVFYFRININYDRFRSFSLILGFLFTYILILYPFTSLKNASSSSLYW